MRDRDGTNRLLRDRNKNGNESSGNGTGPRERLTGPVKNTILVFFRLVTVMRTWPAILPRFVCFSDCEHNSDKSDVVTYL